MNKIFLQLTLVCLNLCSAAQQPDKAAGEEIFKARCAGCHKVNKDFAGPALKGVWDRHSLAWIVQFVNSSQTLVRNGDKEALAIFEKHGRMVMPDHPDITESNVAAVLEYIKAESAVPEEKMPFARPGVQHAFHTPLTLKDTGYFAGYFTLVGLLVISLLLAVEAKHYERQAGSSGNKRSDGRI